MPKFESPIGNKQIVGQPMREFDVPDEGGQEYENMTPVMRHRGTATHGPQPPVDFEAAMAFQNRMESTDDTADLERQMREARMAKRSGKERMNDGAKRRIEMLIGMTRQTRPVDVENNSYVLQTLKGKEIRAAISAAAEFDGTVQSPYEIRRQLLGRSLVQVAGIDIDQFVGSNLLEDKLNFVEEMDDILLNRLYSEYLILVREAKEKYAIKDENAQEVIEDLKK